MKKILYPAAGLVILLVVGFMMADNAKTGGDSTVTKKPAVSVEQPSGKLELYKKDADLGALPGSESSGDFIFTGQVLAGFAINQPIVVTPTSTLNVFTGGRDRSDIVAKWTNTTGKNLICSRPSMPIFTSTDTWTFSYGMGTTTKIAASPSWNNTTTATLIASTTATNASDIVADNFNLFTALGNAGSYFTKDTYGKPTTTDFLLTNGTSIVSWIKTINATSSDSFVKNSGHRLTGSMQVDCRPVSY